MHGIHSFNKYKTKPAKNSIDQHWGILLSHEGAVREEKEQKQMSSPSGKHLALGLSPWSLVLIDFPSYSMPFCKIHPICPVEPDIQITQSFLPPSRFPVWEAEYGQALDSHCIFSWCVRGCMHVCVNVSSHVGTRVFRCPGGGTRCLPLSLCGGMRCLPLSLSDLSLFLSMTL